jgi:hypothetical protein
MLEKHPLRHPVQCILSNRYVYIEKGFFLQLHFLVIKGTANRIEGKKNIIIIKT